MGVLKIFWSPSVPDGDKVDRGVGELQKKSEWSQNCPPNAKLGHVFAILSMKYSFLRYFWA